MLLWNARVIDGTGGAPSERAAVRVDAGRIAGVDTAGGSRPRAPSTLAAGRCCPG